MDVLGYLQVAVQQIHISADPPCHSQFRIALQNGNIESDYIMFHRMAKSHGKARKQNKRCQSDCNLKVSDSKARKQKR